jgi:hypothetical protein
MPVKGIELSALKMEVARYCEMLVNVYQTSRRQIPEDINLRNSLLLKSLKENLCICHCFAAL